MCFCLINLGVVETRYRLLLLPFFCEWFREICSRFLKWRYYWWRQVYCCKKSLSEFKPAIPAIISLWESPSMLTKFEASTYLAGICSLITYETGWIVFFLVTFGLSGEVPMWKRGAPEWRHGAFKLKLGALPGHSQLQFLCVLFMIMFPSRHFFLGFRPVCCISSKAANLCGLLCLSTRFTGD